VDCAPAHPGALAIIARLKIHATVWDNAIATERQAAVVGGALMEMITTADVARVQQAVATHVRLIQVLVRSLVAAEVTVAPPAEEVRAAVEARQEEVMILASIAMIVHAMNLTIARVALIKRTAPANVTLAGMPTMVHAMKLPHLPIATHVQTRLIVASVVVFNLRTS
jgi:hypothetical protein